MGGNRAEFKPKSVIQDNGFAHMLTTTQNNNPQTSHEGYVGWLARH